MQILAIGDLDALFGDYKVFERLLQKEKEPDLFLIAGDLTQWGTIEEYIKLVDSIEKKDWSCPVIACLGNHEPENAAERFSSLSPLIKILDNERVQVNIKGEKIHIVGSRGSLESGSLSYYIDAARHSDLEKRMKTIEKLLGQSRGQKILLTHYAPTYKTLDGEPQQIWGGLGDSRMEKILLKTKTTFAIHGHAHYGSPLAFVGKIPVFDVAFPIRGGFTHIDTKKLPKP